MNLSFSLAMKPRIIIAFPYFVKMHVNLSACDVKQFLKMSKALPTKCFDNCLLLNLHPVLQQK